MPVWKSGHISSQLGMALEKSSPYFPFIQRTQQKLKEMGMLIRRQKTQETFSPVRCLEQNSSVKQYVNVSSM